MRQNTWTVLAVLGLAALCHSLPAERRQTLIESDSIDPVVQDLADEEDTDRDKRKVEGAVEIKYGAKNAILGFIFNKINSFIDSKTNWVAQLDQGNIAKNKAYGIETPKDPVTSFGSVFSSVLSNKLQAVGPFISTITSKLGSGSSGGLGAIGSLLGGASGGSSSGSGYGTTAYGAPSAETDSPY